MLLIVSYWCFKIKKRQPIPMKRKLPIILIFIITISGYGQQLYMEYGSTISSFDYENSQGQPLDNLLSKSKSYFGMGYRKVINNQKHCF